MNRFFCLLDTVDTLVDDRVVINAQTKCNIPQALAEGIIKNDSEPDQLAKAMRQSSDYMEILWIYHKNQNISIEMHVESGDVEFKHGPDDRMYHNTQSSISLKEHQFNHQPKLMKIKFDEYQEKESPDSIITRPSVKLYQQKFEISNRDKVRGVRLEYYQRSCINWKISCAKIVTDHVKVTTSSRKCEMHVEYNHDWRNCAGALIMKSTENKRDHLHQI